MELSAYRFMWVVAMFDLPVDTPDARREYTRFRKKLLKNGFTRLQYSVYVRHCASEENTVVHVSRVEAAVPPDGEVRILVFTDKQFSKMKTFLGRRRKPPPPAPKQLEFF